MKCRPLDKTLPAPLYYQLKTALLSRIRSGDLQANRRLPTEAELEAQYGVSKATVRQALGQLAAAGILRREQGRGTFICEPQVELGPRELTSFAREMRDHGLAPGTRVLAQTVVAADPEIAAKLQISFQCPVVCLRRLRLAGGKPMGIQTAYLPADLAPGLARHDFESASLYEYLEAKYGLVADKAVETHSAVLVGYDDALLLEVAEGSAGLAAERLTFLRDGRPLELVYSLMRGDRYKVALSLSRSAAPEP